MSDLLKRIKKLETEAIKLSDEIQENGDSEFNLLHFHMVNGKFSMIMTMTPRAIEEMLFAIMENNPQIVKPMLCILAEVSQSIDQEIN